MEGTEMDIGTYSLLVALAAIVYSLLARSIQTKLTDKKAMKEMQEESKRLSEEMKKAREQKDTEKLDRIMKEQMELLPKMNKIMLGQFKPMVVIIMIFLAFNYVIEMFNPAYLDDITLQLHDDGKNCDRAADDDIFSGCFQINGSQYGRWSVVAKAMADKTELGKNATYFMYNSDSVPNPYLGPPTGTMIGIATDREKYLPGETVTVLVDAPAKANNVTSIIDAGTAFYVDLPFALPLLGVQRIYETNWWFIFVALIAGLVLSFIFGQLEKRGIIK